MKRFTLGDALRGIAAIGVVALHTKLPLPFAEFNALWPDFFFVLSGLVLAKYYRPDITDGDWKNYAARRAVRFYPLVIVAILVSLAVRFALQFIGTGDAWPASFSAETIIIAVLLGQLLYSPSIAILPPLWSLSAEIIVNLGAYAVVRRFGNWALAAMILFGTAAAAFDTLLHPGFGPTYSTYGGLGRALSGFALGLLIQKYPLRRLTLLGGLGSVALLAWLVWFSNITPMAVAIAPFIFALALWHAVLLEPAFAKTRLTKAAEFLGTYSFGIYVWHEALLPLALKTSLKFFELGTLGMRITYFVLLLAITLVATRLTYRFVEVPTMNWIRQKLAKAV